ncbi:hypothetical protein AVEN_87620-1 [Araneus ventricosus]|uniref:Uncharacterized protein n=1 Tax=Araneus ventricosus TaxID=182803 RepID=A0A4Y2K8Q4_ARAVE|nr:hypothetical protein AVEN_87620-1 [Araneus ventricosus]
MLTVEERAAFVCAHLGVMSSSASTATLSRDLSAPLSTVRKTLCYVIVYDSPVYFERTENPCIEERAAFVCAHLGGMRRFTCKFRKPGLTRMVINNLLTYFK